MSGLENPEHDLKQALLDNFNSLDSDSLTELLHSLGFTAGAFYRLSSQSLIQVLASAQLKDSPWPPAVALTAHYTSPEDSLPPRAWVRLEQLPISATSWPKGAVFYVPEQAFEGEKLLFAGLLASGKRVRSGELDGPLEAISARLRAWLRNHEARQGLSEGVIKEHLKGLALDLRMVIDHELRTPLSSISGYSALLQGAQEEEAQALCQEYIGVLVSEVDRAVKAIDKISLALYADRRQEPHGVLDLFDGAQEVLAACAKMQADASEVMGPHIVENLVLHAHKVTDQPCLIRGDLSLFQTAVWEVIKNAVAHARTGKVGVRIYVSERMLVVDVEDDGSGVSLGAEDLIFLRFYQDPATTQRRRGRRGVGLGLFIARQIVEQHMGSLLFIRQKSGSMFRFLWPLDEEETHG